MHTHTCTHTHMHELMYAHTHTHSHHLFHVSPGLSRGIFLCDEVSVFFQCYTMTTDISLSLYLSVSLSLYLSLSLRVIYRGILIFSQLSDSLSHVSDSV